MANETNYLMNQDGYNVNINSENPEQSYFTATTSNGNLRYVPKKWQTNELIETIEMNNIEQGVQIALTQTDTIQQTANQAVENVRAQMQTFNERANELENELNSAKSSIENDVNSKLNTQNTNLLNALTKLLGSYYTLETITDNLDSNKSTVDTRITQLYNEVFGTNSSGSTSSTSLNTRLATLESTVSNLSPNILDAVGARLGEAYYNINSHAWVPNYTDIDTRITQIYNAIFGESTTGSNKTIIEQIEDLNTAIFGSNSGDSNASLIDKIVAVLGTTLPEANEIPQTGFLSDSLTSQINDIKNAIGIGSSSQGLSLNSKINNIIETIYGDEIKDLGEGYTLSKVLDDLYGNLVENTSTGDYNRDAAPLINSLKELPNSFSTLNTRINAVEQDNTNIRNSLSAMSKWGNIFEQVYIDAEIKKYDDTSYLRLVRDSTINWPETVEDMAQDQKNTYLQLPAGGGGGGATGGGTAIITRITDASVQVLVGNECPISYKLEARDSGNELVGNGNATWFIGGVQVDTSTALNITEADNNIINTFDISPYLSVGANNVTLQISVNTGGENATIVRKTWSVNVINFSLVWDYNEEAVFDNGTITLNWIPYGANINKTTHIIIDNNEIYNSTTMQSGITQTYTFEHNLTHGIHVCEIYLTANINGKNETTVSQFHDLIIVEPGNITPIISSSAISPTMEQYDTIAIPIVVYTPNSTLTSEVILAVNGTPISTWTNVNRNLHYWNYSPSTTGEKTLTITVGSVVKTITITVISISINNKEVEGYDFKIKASEIVSNEDLRNNELLTFSNNFDWINGGIKSEIDSNNIIQQYICVKAGTTMTINKQLFSNNLSNGLDFKIILKITNCSDYDAKVLDCYANDIGVQLFAHNGTLSSSGRTITTQYSENTYIELDFEVYGINDTPRYMMCWVDGVMSVVRVCDSTDQFEQTNKANIVIGSSNCDVNIYLIKNYYKKLSIDEHLANFIADAPNATTMKSRYNRNDILGGDNEIDYLKLYDASPDCRIWLYDIHKMTTGKKKPVKVYRFQQLWKNGGKEYHDGLYAENAILTVQGTSSVNYRKGAANTDINFEGSENTGTPVLRSAGGEDLLANNLTYKGMKLTDNSIPITYANMKVNFASCEQVNNMCNAMWYQNFQPYPSLSPRDCMEFVMGVQFIRDRGLDEEVEEDPTTHEQVLEIPLFSEKNNRDGNKYYMYSIGNLGTSKKNTHIFHSQNECCIEVTDNTTAGQRMLAWPDNLDWSGDIKEADHSYEVRYPKKINNTIATGWERFVRWMANNNPRAATNEPLEQEETYPTYTFRGHYREGTQVLRGSTVSEYAGTYTTDSFKRRMAKMLSECEDYMAMDSVVYHFCYIERHTMVDNVAKNTFWSAAKTNQYINGIEQEDTEGYWIWDLSKNYDNDTSDGNNNEGQLVFDYGNEANDSINGKEVFNAADSVWFVFISNLKEACATMFINREAAHSNDNKFVGAWNSLSYHNFLLQQQQKIPERVWNECYWYDYLRTYERNINTTWLSFLDGGQKIQQRKHYETFQELYLASKYMSPLSIGNIVTLRGYTPTITENMTQEQKDIINTTLAVVPSKSEVTVTMYNKCYLTVHMGNNFKQEKVEKGIPTTLVFKEQNGNYLALKDTVINIDTASMIQEIGDLSPLYPGQSSFGSAYRLKSIKIGSAIEGYQNLNISEKETGSFDFSTNTMLERLEIQNLKSINAPLSLTGCPALKYLDASGSSFTGYSFADGGLLTIAKLGSPTTIVMKNLSYLTDANLIIDSINNLKYLTIDNCSYIDSFNRSLALNNLLKLELLNVNWRVQGIDFNTFVSHIKTIPNYLITGKVELTPEMGTFSVGKLGDTFTKDLKFYNYDTSIEFWSAEKNYLQDNKVQYNENIWISKGDNNIGNEPVEDSEYWTLVGPMAQPYYTVSFYGLYHEWIRNQYIASGNNFIPDNFSDIFTETYINNYNIYKNPNWVNGADSRVSFSSWDKDYLTPVTNDLDVFAQEGLEYKLNYIMHTEDPNVFVTNVFRYYAAGSVIEKMLTSEIPTFVRDYYLYSGNGWTKTDNTNQDPTASQILVPSIAIKEEGPEIWYAVYTKQPNSYTISVYNTDIYGNKQGEPLITLSKKVYSDNQNETRVLLNELNSYRPGLGNLAKDKAIYIDNNTMYTNDLNQTDESKRLYRFLTWQPYVPNNYIGLPVTGDMDILAKYYKADDVFTNYFLNKITTCTLDDSITKLPDGAFLHNSNLRKITTKAQYLGKGCFSYFAKINNNENRRVFIFTATNINIDDYCFYNLSDSLIIFTGTGSISVGTQAFYELKRCIIIILNSNEPIHSSTYINNNFQSFYTTSENQNYLYVTPEARQRYVNNNSLDRIPYNLNGTEGPLNLILEINKTNPTFQNLLQEAGINDY